MAPSYGNVVSPAEFYPDIPAAFAAGVAHMNNGADSVRIFRRHPKDKATQKRRAGNKIASASRRRNR